MKKSSLVFVAALTAATTLIGALPAQAAEVSAKSSSRVEDATGDVPYCQGDIVATNVNWTDQRLSLSLAVACDFSPDDASWYAGESAVGFLLDVNGDNDPDYLANFDARDNGVLYNRSGGVVCRGSASGNNGRGFAIFLAPDCVPSAFTFVAAMIYDENPNGESCVCAEDDSPDGAFAGPVMRGAPPPPPAINGQGYWMLGGGGDVYSFGGASVYGTHRQPGHQVDIEPTPSGRGYWILNDTGGVDIHGDATPLGYVLPNALRPFEVATAISRTPTGKGYWIFTNSGRVFSFGDAQFFGDMSGTKLNGPVLDAIPTPSGMGYYMVGSDGGIFTFGDAAFHGSMGGVRLNAPVQSLVPDADRIGYWLVASDGGIFAFEAEFYGSMGATTLNKPVTGMVGFGNGYLMVGEDGGIFTFGDAPFYGSLGNDPPSVPIVSTAVLNQ